MSHIIASCIFLFSSGYVLFLDYLLLSPRVLQKVLVIPLIILLIVLYHFTGKSWTLSTRPYNKWLFLFGGTIFVQLLVLSTGGMDSPFLIIIHFFMIGISFLFTFSTSLLFLLFSFVTLFIDLSFYQNIGTLFLENPTPFVLRIASLLPIIPIAYIILQQYHAKTVLSSLLKKKVARDEAILSQLSDMIIITDEHSHILSVNDAATRAIQKTPAELVDKPLFDVLLLRDAHDKLVTPNTTISEKSIFTLMHAPTLERQVTIRKHHVSQGATMPGEITFIISYLHHIRIPFEEVVDTARARYEALMQKVKKQLAGKQLPSLQKDLLLMEKIENDTYSFQLIQQPEENKAPTRIDIAQLTKQTVLKDKLFSDMLGIQTHFSLKNFGEKELAPLTVKGYAVKPENLTGPFFTVTSYSIYMQLLIQKLLDLAILLAEKELQLTVQPGRQETVIVEATILSQQLQKKELSDLFIPGYGELVEKANLHIGSGLEGYLIKELTTYLHVLVDISLETKPTSQLKIKLTIPKKVT